jgi:U3 small nucleolar RNA-associated protein 22
MTLIPSSPKRRKLHHDSSQPSHTPDADESALYAGGLYKSSMFKLQIDEMLAEVQPNYEKRLRGADEALHKLKSIIEAIEDRELLPVGRRVFGIR